MVTPIWIKMGLWTCVNLQLFVLHLIISVHRTASCSSISLSLYWFLSISTRAISTLVKRFLWAVGTSLCGSTQLHPHMTTQIQYFRIELGSQTWKVGKTHIFFIFSFVFHFLHLHSHSGRDHLSQMWDHRRAAVTYLKLTVINVTHFLSSSSRSLFLSSSLALACITASISPCNISFSQVNSSTFNIKSLFTTFRAFLERQRTF